MGVWASPHVFASIRQPRPKPAFRDSFIQPRRDSNSEIRIIRGQQACAEKRLDQSEISEDIINRNLLRYAAIKALCQDANTESAIIPVPYETGTTINGEFEPVVVSILRAGGGQEKV